MFYCVDSVQCGLKRKRTPEIEEDEGVSLDEKRIKPDLKREIACLSTDTLLALRYNYIISTHFVSINYNNNSIAFVDDFLLN